MSVVNRFWLTAIKRAPSLDKKDHLSIMRHISLNYEGIPSMKFNLKLLDLATITYRLFKVKIRNLRLHKM